MNVLDVYPTFSWWLCGEDPDEIDGLRELIETSPATAENNRKAYFLVGDAAAFDLIQGAFDEVVVRYTPTQLKRLILEHHARPWLNAVGVLRVDPDPDFELLGRK